MKLIIGLGNPGAKYLKNRHNAGALCAQFLISNFKFLNKFQIKISNEFMNDSGGFVKKVINNLAIKQFNNLYVAHDDLDLPLGKYKIQFGVGPKVHNGILSIENSLNTKDFWRIRIGIDNRKNYIEGEKYVLEDFTDEELEILQKVYAKIRDDLKRLQE